MTAGTTHNTSLLSFKTIRVDRVQAYAEQWWGQSILMQLAWNWPPGLSSTVSLISWWKLLVSYRCCRVPSIPVFMCAALSCRLSCSQLRRFTDLYVNSKWNVLVYHFSILVVHSKLYYTTYHIHLFTRIQFFFTGYSMLHRATHSFTDGHVGVRGVQCLAQGFW